MEADCGKGVCIVQGSTASNWFISGETKLRA